MPRTLKILTVFGFLALGGWMILPTAADLPTPALAATGEFPDEWYFYGGKRPESLRALEGKQAPTLTVKNWIGKSQTLGNLKGKVVIVDFWATWCRPCMNALPHNVELMKKYGDKGLMIIGVHDSNRGSEKMASVAKDLKINYPLAVDSSGKSTVAYKVTFWPTYVVIDRTGKIRAAGLDPESVEKVVTKLLDEKPPQEPAPKN